MIPSNVYLSSIELNILAFIVGCLCGWLACTAVVICVGWKFNK